MWRMERHVPRGGGNSLKSSHNQDFSLIEAFNNLALWGGKKFVSELKRTYKFQRGVYCHTEDNSPKYRMVGEIYQCLTNVDKRLRNKCAIVCVGKKVLSLGRESKRSSETSYACERGLSHELINCETSPEFLSDKVYSLFTTHHSLRKSGATHVALCDSVGSYFRHWCGAFTLAEVLITLGIIGVVAALTLPALINNYEKSVVETRMQKFYTNINAALKLSIVENGDMVDWTFPQDYYDADGSEQFFNTYLKNNLQYLKTVPRVTTSWPTNGIEVDLNDGSAFVLSDTWITYYPNANKKLRSGVDSFIFIINKNGNSVIPHGNELKLNENTLKKVNDVVYSCNGNSHRDYNRSCAAYIMQNGWKIPKYYPWGDLKKVK